MKGDKGGMGIVLRTGISLALRLSKFFLVGMLHQKGIDVNDDRYSLLPNKIKTIKEVKKECNKLATCMRTDNYS